jgi:rRNA maturation endonuclease Nob1
MTATGLVCSSCGIELPQNAKFCLECGGTLAVSAVMVGIHCALCG